MLAGAFLFFLWSHVGVFSPGVGFQLFEVFLVGLKHGDGFLIADAVLGKGPLALEVEEVEEGVDRTIHSKTDIEDVIEADGITEAADVEVADEVREGEERPVEKVQVGAHIDTKYNMGVRDIENEESPQARVGQKYLKTVEFPNVHCIADCGKHQDIEGEDDRQGLAVPDLIEAHVPEETAQGIPN